MTHTIHFILIINIKNDIMHIKLKRFQLLNVQVRGSKFIDYFYKRNFKYTNKLDLHMCGMCGYCEGIWKTLHNTQYIYILIGENKV